jgi:photosystem II stability/assembly factor-like uncharacterized protein
MNSLTTIRNLQKGIIPTATGILLTLLLGACAQGAAPSPTLNQATQAPAAPSMASTNLPAPTETATLPTTTLSITPTTALTPTTTVSATSSLPTFNWIDMTNTQTGYGMDEKNLYRTENGGIQWKVITPPGASANFSVFFLDDQEGWMLAGNPKDLSESTLFHTTDGGINWTSTPAPFGMGRLQFLDEQNGWAMANFNCGAGSCGVDIFKTTDGGKSWDRVSTASPDNNTQLNVLPFGGDKNGMTFLDMQHGWVGGSEPKNGYVWLFATQDGGESWKQVNLPLPSKYISSTISVDPPKFFNAKSGILPVTFFTDSSYKGFYRTQDGGQSWKPGSIVGSNGIVSIPTLQDIFIWDGGTLQTSHDGGKTWTAITPNIDLSQIIAQLDFIDKNTGWATSIDANMKGMLYKTIDGGKTWVALGN